MNKEIFGVEMNEAVVHSVLEWYLASCRRGTHSAKTRAEVRGGGAKPWRQKGTGRARAGSSRSPLWRTGGVTFGPKPRGYGFSLPRKVRKLGLRIVLSDKVKQGKMKVVEELNIPELKTKHAVKLMKDNGLSGKVLFITEKQEVYFWKAAQNISGVTLSIPQEINIFDLLNSEWVVADKKAVAKIEEVLS